MYLAQNSQNQQPNRQQALGISQRLDYLLENLTMYLKTTPGKLAAAMLLCIVGTSFLGMVAYHSYANLRGAVQTVGRDTVPSIIAAEHINATLADANANAMNALLVKEQDNGMYWKVYRDEMNQVHDELITAAQNITYGDEERKPIFTIMARLGDYESLIGKAKGRPINEVMNDFTTANKIMRQEILPASLALDQANFAHLDAVYKTHHSGFGMSVLFFWMAVGLLLAILGATQLYLYRTTHRMLNLGLVVATVIVLGFSLYTNSLLKTTEASLVVAKQDAFDSVHALWKARAIAYDGNADESLFLIYHGNVDAQTKSTADFKAKAGKITDIEPQTAVKKVMASQKFGGLLGEELANITFKGEGEAALETLKGWAEYIRIDGAIRELEKQGRYTEALQMDIGTKPGQSNWAFAQFDKALDQTLAINQAQFDNGISTAFGKLNVFPYMLAVCIVLIIVASIVGIKVRFDEYRF